jgi:hypothetical protein
MNMIQFKIVFLSLFSVYDNEERSMIQSQYQSPGRQHLPARHHSRLLQQHPVLTAVFLLAGAVGLFIVSFSADRLFPTLALLGIPASYLCLLLALVLGISGILVCIIYLIERIDHHHSQRLQAGAFMQSKEHSYANRH